MLCFYSVINFTLLLQHNGMAFIKQLRFCYEVFTEFLFSVEYYHPVQITLNKDSPSRLQQNAEVSCCSAILCSSKLQITNYKLQMPIQYYTLNVCWNKMPQSMKINNLDVFWQNLPRLAMHFSCLRNRSSCCYDNVWPVPPREETNVVSVTNTRTENMKTK